MARKASPILISLIIILLLLPTTALAETSTLHPDSWYIETRTLDKGETIQWEWEVVGEGNVSFWIEAENGTQFSFLDEARQSQGNFTVPSSGTWTVNLYNDGNTTITVEHSISIADRDLGGVVILLVVLIFAVIIALLTLIILALAKERKEFKREFPEEPGKSGDWKGPPP